VGRGAELTEVGTSDPFPCRPGMRSLALAEAAGWRRGACWGRVVPGARVVVAVDGSQRSVPTLRWAGFEALRRNADLVAVHASGRRRADPAPARQDPLSTDRTGGEAVARLEDCLRAAFGDRPPVPVHPVVDSRGPVPALLAACEGAVLLVLAARPDPRRPGLVRGTIAQQCLQRAACPVVVLLAAASSPAGAARPPGAAERARRR
jgi:nucleotide-binding universal stress UspA family protein